MAAVVEMGGEANNPNLDSISKLVSDSKSISDFDVQKMVDMFTKLNPLAKEFFPLYYSPLQNHICDHPFAVNNNKLSATDNQANNRRVQEGAEPPVSEGKTGADTAGCNSHFGSPYGLQVPNANRQTFRCPDRRIVRPSGSHSIEGARHFCVVPQSTLRPLVGKVSGISRQLTINLLDMEAALPEEAFRPLKAQLERRWAWAAWREFVKSTSRIYEIHTFRHFIRLRHKGGFLKG